MNLLSDCAIRAALQVVQVRIDACVEGPGPRASPESQARTAKVPILKGGALVVPAGLLLNLEGQSDPAAADAAARKRVKPLAMNAVFEGEKALGHMPKDVSSQRGLGYDIESIDAGGNLFLIEVKGWAAGADSVTLTINEVNTGRNAPHRFRLGPVSVAGDRASPPVYRRRHRLGPAGLRRHPDHQEPAAAAGGGEGSAWTTGAMQTPESSMPIPESYFGRSKP